MICLFRGHRFGLCHRYFNNQRKNNGSMLILFLLIINISDDFKFTLKSRSSVVNASYYPPNWQQYYQYQKWAPYDQQIQGRPSRLRIGQGKYRLMPVGAQLICDFPDAMMLMISNIIWERADMGHGNDLDQLYRDHGIQQDYILISRPRGSTLHLLEVTPLDRGLYRCIASALDSNTGKTVTLFQDVHFYPIF